VAKQRKKTRLQELRDYAQERGLSVHTWAPGDGVTRYRFFELPEDPHQMYFGPATGIFTALGLKEAYTFLHGVPAVRDNPWPARYKKQGRAYDRCVASIGEGYNPYAVCGATFKKSMGKRAFGKMLSARRRMAKGNPSTKISSLTTAQIKAMPTIHSGHFANLKIDDGKMRVWVMRVGRADGYYGPSVTYECLVRGVWVDCNKYGIERSS
jgi:hypothetical protein